MNLGTPPINYDSSEQARMRSTLETEDRKNLKRGAAEAYWLLRDPDGNTWKGTISNLGALTWAKVAR